MDKKFKLNTVRRRANDVYAGHQQVSMAHSAHARDVAARLACATDAPDEDERHILLAVNPNLIHLWSQGDHRGAKHSTINLGGRLQLFEQSQTVAGDRLATLSDERACPLAVGLGPWTQTAPTSTSARLVTQPSPIRDRRSTS